MLEFARSQTYAPGSNPRQEQSGAAWVFLLGSLDVGRIVVAGSPSASTRAALAPLAGEVTDAGDAFAAALDGPCGLVVVGAGLVRELAQQAPTIAALERVLADGGAVFLEESPATVAAVRHVAATLGIRTTVEIGAPDGEAGRSEVGRAVWLIPGARSAPGRMTQALWALDRRLPIVRSLHRGRLHAPAPEEPLAVARVSDVVGAPGGERHAALLRSDAPSPGRLPAYVRTAAAEQGHDLEDVGWTLAPLRGYRSQKVVFATSDGQIVKVTQDPRFNARLENEYSGLAVVGDRGLLDAARAPRALFCGRHAGLTVVAETEVAGAPFRLRSDATPGCPVARSALETLGDLATTGAVRDPASPTAAVDALADLLERHRRLHAPPPAQLRLLEGQLERIAGGSAGELPAVFLHGDPSTLNLLVGPEGRVGLVDWENAEPQGPPLWDVIYFVNAFAAWNAERSGRRWTPATIEATLVDPSPFHDLLAGAIARQRAALGLPEELVAPLFFFFWMFLALREATRRPDPAGGPYARTLARLAAAGESRGVRALAGRPR